MTKTIIKECTTCGENGHTYLECPKVPFGFLMAGAFGVPMIDGGEAEYVANLQQLHDEGKGIGKVQTFPTYEERPDEHGPWCEDDVVYKGCKTCWQRVEAG